MRLSPHYQGWPGRKDQFRQWINTLKPTGAKFVAEGLHNDLIEFAKASGCITIGRLAFSQEEMSLAATRHGALVHKIMNAASSHPAIMVWESPYNESFAQTGELARHSERAIEFMRECEARHVKAGIGLFALGTPQLDDWALFMPALIRCIANGHYLILHEYAAPMQFLCGGNVNGLLVDACQDWGHEEGWTTLRVVRVIRKLKELRLDVDKLNIIIGESGNDIVTGLQPWPGRGYKDHAGKWWTQDARFGNYAQQQAWYCRHLSHIKQVKVVTDFGFASDPAKWSDFDMSDDPVTFNEMLRLQAELPREHYGGATPIPRPTYYQVQRGDTLSRIGASFGVPWRTIAAANGIVSPYIINPGDLLLIPGANAQPSASGLYTVVNGPYTSKRDIGTDPKRWIIVHDPGVEAPLATIVKAMLTTATTSYNEIFGDPGDGDRMVARVLVPDTDTAWHAGRDSRIPGTNVRNAAVNRATYGIACTYPLPERAYLAFVQRIVDLIRHFRMPDAGVVLGHREVASLRSDPRLPAARSMDQLRRDIASRL